MTPTAVKHTIPPVFAPDSLVLLLGTMPSPQSRRQGFYYGHPQNRFWRALAEVFGAPVPEVNDIAAKKRLLLQNRLALWDVLADCLIDGAADSSIKAPNPNDIAGLIPKTQIQAVFCTGQKAWQLYQRLCLPACHIPAELLPSTSPANRRVSDAELLAAYQKIKSRRDSLLKTQSV